MLLGIPIVLLPVLAFAGVFLGFYVHPAWLLAGGGFFLASVFGLGRWLLTGR